MGPESQWPGTIRRHALYKSAALPTELHWQSSIFVSKINRKGDHAKDAHERRSRLEKTAHNEKTNNDQRYDTNSREIFEIRHEDVL
jgi:hypothetical protein